MLLSAKPPGAGHVLERILNPDTAGYKNYIRHIPTNQATDPKLKKALEALSIGHIGEALETLTNLSEKDPAYQRQLLSALILSKKPEDWEHAEKLLEQFGTLEQYSRLSVNFWTIKNVDKAISLVKQARKEAERLIKNGLPVEPIVMYKIKNNLAYYYADALKKDEAEIAMALAKDAVASASQVTDAQGPLSNARALATFGFVKIVFGVTREEIQEGMKDCEDARRLGADQKLYFKHIEHARERLSTLK